MIEKNIHKIVIGDTSYNIVDKSISKWAKEKTKPSYTPEEVNAMGNPSYVCNEHDLITNNFSKSGWCFIGNIIRPFDNYLTIEALENYLTVSFSSNAIQYSIDNCQTWNELPADTATPVINAGDMISFKATGLVPVEEEGIGRFIVNKKFNLKGNVMSMLFGAEGYNNYSLTGYNYVFYKLFYRCATLQSVSKDFLPATTLAEYCYSNMFDGCTSLVAAPELPSTTLASGCYANMFSNCASLVTAPELPATTLASGCYANMFSNCASLVTAPELPATTLADRCYSYMFNGCASLVNAPELPATELVDNCYDSMFAYCWKLNYIKALFITEPGSNYTSNWVSGVSSTGAFVKNVAATWNVTGHNGIPSGWTVDTNLTPIRCINLSITADNVRGNSTNTTIYWTAKVVCVNDEGLNSTVTLKGTDTSEFFPQNTSTTDTIERTISYTYMGVTATTTITQGIWIDCSYTINLNNQWQSSSVVNPDSSLYDGVYESFSNKGVNSTAATMYIDIEGYTDFDLYIRSHAESSYDYVMVSQLDQTINNSTSYSNTTLVKAHTRGNQKSGTSIGDYTLVSFTGIDEGQHRITIVYRKDDSGNSGNDRGYVLIPKNQ